MSQRKFTWEGESELSPEQIEDLHQKVLSIYSSAKECHSREADEENWSDQVVLKLLEFSIGWGGYQQDIKLINL